MPKTKQPTAIGYPYDVAPEDIYTDPWEEWIADHSEEWSYKHPGKYLALVDFQVLGVYDSGGEAYDEARDKYPEGEITVWYVPREKELEMIL